MISCKPSLGVRCLSCYTAFSFLVAPIVGFAQEVGGEAPGESLPPGSLTIGALYTEDYWEGIGDVLVPLLFDGEGLLFLNPRSSRTDNSATEFNLGVGYRRLIRDRAALAGANLYYDYRDTTAGTKFHQFGAGVEYLSRRLDARANVYIPTETRKRINEFHATETSVSRSTSQEQNVVFGAPYAQGNEILQPATQTLTTRTRTTTTSTTRFYEQHEIAFWGWDAEIGTELPIPAIEDYVRIKPFAGVVNYYGRSGVPDIEAFRGRLEIHIRPSFFLDAVYLSDDKLNGGNFSLGAYLTLPFEIGNIAQGRNPFSAANERWQFGTGHDVTWRLADMVKRDPQIRSTVADSEEREDQRTTTTAVANTASTEKIGSDTLVVETDITFVDGTRGSDTNPGTFEAPKKTVQGGVDAPRSMVFVFDIPGSYDENVTMTKNVYLRGSGAPILAYGGQSYGSGIHPLLNGGGGASDPTITMAANTIVQGFRIQNQVGGVVQGSGIFSGTGENLLIADNQIEQVANGVEVVTVGDVNVRLRNNKFSEYEGNGAFIDGTGASGTYFVDARNNTFDGGFAGLHLSANNYDEAYAAIHGLYAANATIGAILQMQAENAVIVGMSDVTAENNVLGINANLAADNGIALLFGGLPESYTDLANDLLGSNTIVDALFAGSGPISANNNIVGMNVNLVGGALSALALLDVEASSNLTYGVNGSVVSPNGIALSLVGSSETLSDVLSFGASALDALGLGLGLPPVPSGVAGPARFNHNAIGGLNLDVQGEVLAIGIGLGIEANHNALANGVRQNVVSPNGFALNLLGRVEANNNGLMGIDSTASGNVLGASLILDTHTSNNNIFGINQHVEGGIALGLIASTDTVRFLTDFANDALALDPPTLGPVVANNNALGGINSTVDGSFVGIGAYLGIEANGNEGLFGMNTMINGDGIAALLALDVNASGNDGYGLLGNVNSDSGVALSLVGSSQTLFETLNFGTSALEALGLNLGIPALPVPPTGPAKFNDNGLGGLDISVQGDSLALGLGLGIEANNSLAGHGVRHAVSSPNGVALNLLGRVEANNNVGNGIQSETVADFLAASILLDTHTSDNTLSGIRQHVEGNLAIGLIASTDPIRSLMDRLNDDLSLDPPIVVPGAPFGPVVANNNDGSGIDSTIVGQNLALGAFLDVQANDNGAFGIDSTITSTDGAAIGFFASSDQLFTLVPPILGDLFLGDPDAIPVVPPAYPMGNLSASGNDGGGINSTVNGHFASIALFAGIEASNNEDTFGPGSGLRLDAASTDGSVLIGMNDITANDNAGFGIDIEGGAFEDVSAFILNTEVSNNDRSGLRIDLDSAWSDTTLVLAGVQAHDNDIRGIQASLAADANVQIAITDTHASGNLRHGIRINAYAGEDLDLWAGALAVEDLAAALGGGATLDLFASVMPSGGNSFDNNGHHPDMDTRPGMTLNLEAGGDIRAAVTGNTFHANSGPGLRLDMLSTGGDVAALLVNNQANGNGTHGFAIHATAGGNPGDTAAVVADGNIARDNDNVGLHIQTDGDQQYVSGSGNVLTGNRIGLRVRAEAGASDYELDFGNDALGTAGNNSIFGNTDFDARHLGASSLLAENNWWGTPAPDPAQFGGSVDYTPALATDPNP